MPQTNGLHKYNEEEQTYDIRDAIREASRCLGCKKPSCQQGCPINNDISEFISEIASGNFGQAREVIARKSNLPAVCGRVCAHELQCEGHCILAPQGKGIRIGMLERFAADFAFQMAIPLDKVAQKTRGRVAVIGSGPAGLTVAGDLAKIGFGVTVYEAMAQPGGLLMYGIPEFRLPHEVVQREIQRIEALGVAFLNGVVAGRDFTVDDLFQKGNDAVFIGSGTAVARDLDLPGRDLGGIMQAGYLLRMKALHDTGQVQRDEVPVAEGDRVLVIGAGNAAIDAARTSVRLGAAAVTILYRGTEETMPALPAEVEAARKEGVSFRFEMQPEAFRGVDGRFTALLAAAPGGPQELPADKLLIAIGSRPANRIVSTTEGIEVDAGGYVAIKQRPYGMTTRKGVFAGGDVVHHPATVVLAMKEAKRVAAGIAEYVDAVKLLEL